MAFNPTESQKMAIETNGNILVSAAAGSGKTAVLVERIINKLLDKDSAVSADRLLVVTFTNAAAAEMRERIEKRLAEEIQKDPQNVSLLRQKYLISSADISTIDAFCIKFVRENFEKCGVEPDFKICDNAQQSSICDRVMKNVLAEYTDVSSADFMKLLEITNCEFDETGLMSCLGRVYEYIQQLPFPENFIDTLIKPYVVPFDKGNPWYDESFNSANNYIKKAKDCIEKMYDAAVCVEKNSEKHIDYANYMAKTVQNFHNTVMSKDWNSVYSFLSDVSFGKVPTGNKEDINTVLFRKYKAKIVAYFKSLKDIFANTKANMQYEISRYHNAINLFADMLKLYSKQLFDAFCEENVLTFSLIEQLTLNLLCKYEDGKITVREDAKTLCDRYDEVLVDEFQDVNDLQDMLFYILSNREEKLFVVGDVKQSIYGFRGSNPENFLLKKQRYKHFDKATCGEPKKIILSDNFRSRKGICETVNFFFSQFMAGQCGNLIYDKEEYLNSGGTFKESDAPQTELLVIDNYREDDEYEGEDEAALETEARKIAEYILSVMKEDAFISDGNSLRKAKFSDFAVLLDKLKARIDVISQVFADYGIPVALSGGSFLESYEISAVMSLLQVIDNPKCDIELLTVMMSPVFGFTAEEMADIRANQKQGQLYSAVVCYSKTGDKKTSDFLQKLDLLRREAAVLSVDRLISRLIHSADILNNMTSMPGGKLRRANLFALIKFAQDYTARSNGGIYGFIKYMKSLPDNSFKDISASTDNAVKIMTMHNSKGLQFPVCIIANLSSKINKKDATGRFLFSKEFGISFNYYDESLGEDIRTLGHILSKEQKNSKTVEEKLRLLYVAMTRAQDRLCIVCFEDNLESKLKKTAEELSETAPHITAEFLESSAGMDSWILAAALLHPNGEKLCRYADANAFHIKSDTDLKINIVKASDRVEKENFSASVSEEKEYNKDLVDKIKINIGYEYPYEKLRFLQAKSSVSALVNGAESERFAFTQKPAFMLGDKLSGAGHGTAMHHIMQFIKFDENVDVSSEIERLTEWKFISEAEANSADTAAIERFFESDIYRRIKASGNVHREMRFLTEIPAKSVDLSLEHELENANIVVQGAVDLCFEEDDGIVVLDFKTDRADSMESLVKCYGEQLEIYAKAAEKIFKKPVKEKIIYSFCLDKTISF